MRPGPGPGRIRVPDRGTGMFHGAVQPDGTTELTLAV
jgi:hypothetical protein